MQRSLWQTVGSILLAVGLQAGVGLSADPAPAADTPDDATTSPPTPDSQERVVDPSARFQALVTRIVLDAIPHEFEDTSDWGKTTEVWAGLRVWRDGWQIKTKRRKKQVKDGTWKRYQIRLVDPQRQFQVRVENVRRADRGRVEFDAWVEAALAAYGRLSVWERGVLLISLSTDADARVRLRVHCNLGVQIDPGRLPPDVILDPVVTDADLALVDFDIRRISDLRGPLAKSLSHSVREVLEARIARRRQALVDDMNRQIAKNKDALRLSVHDLARSKWGDLATQYFGLDAPNP